MSGRFNFVISLVAALLTPSAVQAQMSAEVTLEPGYVFDAKGITEFAAEICANGPSHCTSLKKGAQYASDRLERMIALPATASNPRSQELQTFRFFESILLDGVSANTETNWGLVFRYTNLDKSWVFSANNPDLQLRRALPKTTEGRLKLARLVRQVIVDHPN